MTLFDMIFNREAEVPPIFLEIRSRIDTLEAKVERLGELARDQQTRINTIDALEVKVDDLIDTR